MNVTTCMLVTEVIIWEECSQLPTCESSAGMGENLEQQLMLERAHRTVSHIVWDWVMQSYLP